MSVPWWTQLHTVTTSRSSPLLDSWSGEAVRLDICMSLPTQLSHFILFYFKTLFIYIFLRPPVHLYVYPPLPKLIFYQERPFYFISLILPFPSSQALVLWMCSRDHIRRAPDKTAFMKFLLYVGSLIYTGSVSLNRWKDLFQAFS